MSKKKGYKTNPNLLIKDEKHEIDGLKANIIIFDEKEIYTKKPNKKYRICKRCGRKYYEPPAISRKDNRTKLCSKCGNEEALLDYFFMNDDGDHIPRID